MQKDLEDLICNINIRFLKHGELWEMDTLYNKINLKKKSVKDINAENNILETICISHFYIKKQLI